MRACRLKLKGGREHAMTPEQRCGLSRLMLRWPERRHQLAQAHDTSLADLYESYETASVAFAHWSIAATPEAEAFAAEYRQLIAELEGEIGNALDRASPELRPR